MQQIDIMPYTNWYNPVPFIKCLPELFLQYSSITFSHMKIPDTLQPLTMVYNFYSIYPRAKPLTNLYFIHSYNSM